MLWKTLTRLKRKEKRKLRKPNDPRKPTRNQTAAIHASTGNRERAITSRNVEPSSPPIVRGMRSDRRISVTTISNMIGMSGPRTAINGRPSEIAKRGVIRARMERRDSATTRTSRMRRIFVERWLWPPLTKAPGAAGALHRIATAVRKSAKSPGKS
jgi:hypothetical protein